jgi:hypothetical protein
MFERIGEKNVPCRLWNNLSIPGLSAKKKKHVTMEMYEQKKVSLNKTKHGKV